MSTNDRPNMKLSLKDLMKIYKEGDSQRELVKKAREELGIDVSRRSVGRTISKAKRAGLMEIDKDNVVHENEMYKGRTTTFYERDEEGKVQKIHHLKVDAKKEDMLEQFKEAVEKFVESVPAKERDEIETWESDGSGDTLTVYTIGDAHIGMMSWHKETGEDYDLQIAEKNLKKAMELLVKQSVASDECLIVDVGDYFHSDNADNRTAKSGNALDVDGRYGKVLEVGLRITTELINMALEKHAKVRWRSAIGNHNEHSAMMIGAFLKAWYRKDARVVIHDEPNMFYYTQFGKCLVGITHGHTVKGDNLGEIMSVDCEDVWSQSKYRYWYCGHIHHDTRKEYRSCVVETFRTLAPKDAWHHSSGYRSGQDMKAITLHREYGEISRNTVNIAMIRGK
jgi:hypothetical protein